mmetsp:Transcript_5329/g.10635  ORF Transcript_5329/g.10635 Transcript_5329/m.10635 type:complete len:84 (-) Transcript_5329:62-313(-)
MSNPECVDCKPSTSRGSHPMSTHECKDTYKFVASCMEGNNNQVTACRLEWDAFRKCMEKGGTEKTSSPPPRQSFFGRLFGRKG